MYFLMISVMGISNIVVADTIVNQDNNMVIIPAPRWPYAREIVLECDRKDIVVWAVPVHVDARANSMLPIFGGKIEEFKFKDEKRIVIQHRGSSLFSKEQRAYAIKVFQEMLDHDAQQAELVPVSATGVVNVVMGKETVVILSEQYDKLIALAAAGAITVSVPSAMLWKKLKNVKEKLDVANREKDALTQKYDALDKKHKVISNDYAALEDAARKAKVKSKEEAPKKTKENQSSHNTPPSSGSGASSSSSNTPKTQQSSPIAQGNQDSQVNSGYTPTPFSGMTIPKPQVFMDNDQQNSTPAEVNQQNKVISDTNVTHSQDDQQQQDESEQEEAGVNTNQNGNNDQVEKETENKAQQEQDASEENLQEQKQPEVIEKDQRDIKNNATVEANQPNQVIPDENGTHPQDDQHQQDRGKEKEACSDLHQNNDSEQDDTIVVDGQLQNSNQDEQVVSDNKSQDDALVEANDANNSQKDGIIRYNSEKNEGVNAQGDPLNLQAEQKQPERQKNQDDASLVSDTNATNASAVSSHAVIILSAEQKKMQEELDRVFRYSKKKYKQAQSIVAGLRANEHVKQDEQVLANFIDYEKNIKDSLSQFHRVSSEQHDKKREIAQTYQRHVYFYNIYLEAVDYVIKQKDQTAIAEDQSFIQFKKDNAAVAVNDEEIKRMMASFLEKDKSVPLCVSVINKLYQDRMKDECADSSPSSLKNVLYWQNCFKASLKKVERKL